MKKSKQAYSLFGVTLCVTFIVAALLPPSSSIANRENTAAPNGRFKVSGTRWLENKNIKRIYYTCDNGNSFYYDIRLTQPQGCNYHDDLGWVDCFSRADQQHEKFDRMCGYK